MSVLQLKKDGIVITKNEEKFVIGNYFTLQNEEVRILNISNRFKDLFFGKVIRPQGEKIFSDYLLTKKVSSDVVLSELQELENIHSNVKDIYFFMRDHHFSLNIKCDSNTWIVRGKDKNLQLYVVDMWWSPWWDIEVYPIEEYFWNKDSHLYSWSPRRKEEVLDKVA